MKSNTAPQAIRALKKHRPFLTHVYTALEVATELAREFFNQPGHQPDGHFFSHSVRYHVARQSLVPDVQEARGFRLFVLPNTGLEVTSRGDRFRIWRATGDEEEDGGVPAPGDAAGRLAFCNQPQAPLFEEGLFAVRDPGKLILLWDIDSSNGLSMVRLACPWYWDSPWKSPKTHWNVAVPHPATWAEGQDFSETGDDFGIDLDLLDEPEQ